MHVNPLDSNLVMSAGNDHTARIFDLRLLTSSEPPAAAVKGTSNRLLRFITGMSCLIECILLQIEFNFNGGVILQLE